MKKIAFILSLFIFFSYSTVFSFNSSESYEDMVTVIIETYENNLYVYNDIYDKIKALSPSVSPIRYTYTSLFYGFSINTDGSYIDTIKEIKGVKNIYISKSLTLPEYIPGEDNETFSNIELFSLRNSYNGKGTVVAVIDSEFYIKHNCFKEPDDYKLSIEDMKSIYENNNLLTEQNKATYEDTWYNTKIPFYYDYGEKDTNTAITNSSNYHGTMVASIVGGDNSFISNYSSKTQLALFKVSDSNGILSNEDIILAALDDAYKMNVDAVNISFGDTAGFINKWSDNAKELDFGYISKKFKDAGIPVFVASGNSSNAGSVLYNDKYYSLAENPDYGTLSSYASQKDVVTIGATQINASGNYDIANYSTVGATNDLRIAPDMVTNGTVACAYPSGVNSYKRNLTGTSFATPLACSMYLACKEYYKSFYTKFTNKEINTLIEQAMMSTATIIEKNGAPVSPRMQGAGVPDIENALSTPVVLMGSDEKSKINLYETMDNVIEFEFKAKNISQKSYTYSLSLHLTKEDYINHNNQIINTMTPVLIDNAEYIFDCGNSITIAPEETKTIKGRIIIPQDIINIYENVFTNGYFLEGYIKLVPEDDFIPSLNIPYMTFKGTWNNIPVFDTQNVYNAFGFYYQNNDDMNLYKNGTYYVNPANTSFRMGALRNISKLTINLTKNNNTLIINILKNIIRKAYIRNNTFVYNTYMSRGLFPDELSEGEYQLIYKAETDTADPHIHNLTHNIIIDRSEPQITEVKRIFKDNKIYLKLTLKDNFGLNKLEIKKYTSNNLSGTLYSENLYTTIDYSKEFDITDFQTFDYEIKITDNALNSAVYKENSSDYSSYIAGYDNKDRLISVVLKPGMLSLNAAKNESAYLNDENISYIRYFVWNGFNPVIKPITLK